MPPFYNFKSWSVHSFLLCVSTRCHLLFNTISIVNVISVNSALTSSRVHVTVTPPYSRVVLAFGQYCSHLSICKKICNAFRLFIEIYQWNKNGVSLFETVTDKTRQSLFVWCKYYCSRRIAPSPYLPCCTLKKVSLLKFI